MGQGVMDLGILGCIKVTPRRAKYPVWRHDGVNGRVSRDG